jgi:hypothetical protein
MLSRQTIRPLSITVASLAAVKMLEYAAQDLCDAG